MSSSGAKRQAREAAERSDVATAELRQQTKILKQRSDREKERSGRLLMRSIRAGGGGFYETTASERSTPTLTGQPKRSTGGSLGEWIKRLEKV